jgi:hypothetical protein
VALTLPRWTLIAGLGALALAVAYLPPGSMRQTDHSMPTRTPEAMRLDHLNNAYGETEQALRAIQFRDSLRRVLARRGDGDGVEVAFELSGPYRTALSPENYALMRAAAQRLWTRVNPVPGARLIIIVGAGRFWLRTYLLPVALDGRTCVAQISLDWEVQWLRQPRRDGTGTNLEPWLREAIAPCLYYAAFGRPGAEIEAWLTRRAFVPAYTADWDSPQPILRFEDDPSRYDYLYYNASFDALACTDGRLARCGPAVQAAPAYLKASPVEGMVRRQFLARSLPAENYYLAALVHDNGRDRFAAFWRSSASVPDAFAAAFGKSMDQWTAAWARRSVPDLPPFGPTPRPIAVLLGILMSGVAIGAAAAGVMRRRGGGG